jgi:hypothetical protein
LLRSRQSDRQVGDACARIRACTRIRARARARARTRAACRGFRCSCWRRRPGSGGAAVQRLRAPYRFVQPYRIGHAPDGLRVRC